MILLPNMRWLTLPSAFQGEDWREVSLEIDQAIAGTSLDLAEEVVYLLYDSDPESVLRGDAQCKVARSVIGPKKTPEKPLELLDWKAAKVFKTELAAKTWDAAFHEAVTLWNSRPNKYKVFILCIHRALKPDLSISLEAIFAE